MLHTTLPFKSSYLARLLVISVFIASPPSLQSCNTHPSEHYGFLTMLGNDTISVESITRQGNEFTSDEVDRFPRLHIRHTVVTLDSDGSIRHLNMDIHTPSEPRGQQNRRVVADVNDNKVHLTKTDSTGTITRDFVSDGSPVVAHVPQMYSLYELYFEAALKKAGNSSAPVALRQFYIDREFDRFPLGHATVRPLGGGRAEINHDWLSGFDDAVLDSAHHLLSYSGARSTYKVEVKRLEQAPDITAIINHFTAAERNAGAARSLSVRDTVRAQIGNAVFTVDYGRPLLRGRTLLGDVIPYDRIWRTGANAATQFTTTAAIRLAGLQLAPGTYTLWTVPHTSSVDLIVNKQFGQWGTDYRSSFDLGKVPMVSQRLGTPVEQFTIAITPKDATHGTLTMRWGDFQWAAPLEVVK
jgi:hypothetical protein